MTKHVIYVVFSKNSPPEWWVKSRIHMFLNSCYKSIAQQKNQLGEMPDIWLYCGMSNKHITDAVDWPEGIRIVYGDEDIISELNKIESIGIDHLAITRIDSDDMFHKDALSHVYKDTEKRKCNNVVALSFHEWLCWMQLENKIYEICNPVYYPPTVTKIIPKAVYANHKRLIEILTAFHGVALKAITNQIYSLPKHMILIARGEINVSYLWNNRDRRKKLGREMPFKPSYIFDDFGITDEYVMMTKPV